VCCCLDRVHAVRGRIRGTIMNDRIKLAEAMEWTKIVNRNDNGPWMSPVGLITGLWGISPEGIGPQKLPDPFTDANDDYACLQFARKQGNPLWTPFMHHCEGEQHQYEIGNWAKALLIAIEITNYENG